MLQLLPQNDIVTPNTQIPSEAVDYINSYIDNYHCENMTVDISFMNVLDACYVSTLCSTKHYIKYPQGKINWKISSEIIREFNKDLEIGTADYL